MGKIELTLGNLFSNHTNQKKSINNNLFPFKVVLIYTLISQLWIILSDKLLFSIIKDIHILNKFQTYKGSFFIILTSIFLFYICSNLSVMKSSLDETNEKIKEKENLLNSTIEHTKTQSQLFSNLSHDLKTPLNLIFTSIQVLESNLHITAEQPNKYINIIRQNCYRLIKLINNIIDISKYNSDFSSIQLRNHNIVQVVEDVSLSAVQHIESKGIQLIFDTDIEQKITACDSDKIERIILNLLSNAIKHTPSGGIIYVNIYDKVDNIIISVKDTGNGIEKEKQKEIFDRFMKINNSNLHEYERNGLGLSIVKSLVEMHKGTISCESEYGKGSEFIIRLPVILSSNKDISHESSDKKSQNDFLEKINIEFSDIYFDN